MTEVTQPTDAGMAQLEAMIRGGAYADAMTRDYPGEIDPGARAVADLSLAGKIEAHLGSMARHYDWQREQARVQLARRLRGIAPVWLPPIPYTPVNGAISNPDSRSTAAGEAAPQDGYVWFITRLVVAGLTSAQGQSATAAGTATNPGAAGVITSISGAALQAIAPRGGLFAVSWLASLQGTIAAGDANNMQLTSPLGTAIQPGIFPGVAGNYTQAGRDFVVPAGQGINIQAIGAASGASAVYGGQITATYQAAGDTVTLSKVSATGLNNYLGTFTAAQPDKQFSSSSFFLLPDDNLILTGTGLNASQVVLSGQAVQVELALLADYLM